MISKNKIITIGVSLDGFTWSGGINLLFLLIRALSETKNFRLIFLVSHPYSSPLLSPLHLFLSRLRTHRSPLLNTLKSAYPQFKIVFYPHTARHLQHIVNQYHIDLIFPTLSPPPHSLSIPWVGYIYDFQHRYLPSLFSSADTSYRNRTFSLLARRAPALLVTSNSVQQDVVKFYPHTKAKIITLPFTSLTHPHTPLSLSHINRKYNLKKPYFLICNQFWQHKNHLTAIKALSLLPSKYKHVSLVCTGKTSDYRNPAYFQRLTRKIHQLNLTSRVHLLGFIPKQDQLSLLKHATALIQPSLFEGVPGGLSVQEAAGLATPVIVADIPINHEIKYPCLRFFNPHQPAALAQQMQVCLQSKSKHPPTAKITHYNQKHLLQLSRLLRRQLTSLL